MDVQQTFTGNEGAALQGGPLCFMGAVIEGTTVTGTVRAPRSELQGKAGERRPSGSQGHALRVAATAASLDTPASFSGRSPVVHSGHPAGHEQLKGMETVHGIRLTGGVLAVIHEGRSADPVPPVPERGMTGPVPIGQVMEPLRRIIAHPDRNRLLAQFCRDNW